MNSKLEERLREAANNVGGIRALSVKSGIGERTIANWLTGTEPRVHALHAVATAAGVSLDWLLTGEDLMEHTPLREEKSLAYSSELAVDVPLMGLCSGAFGDLYKEMGVHLSNAHLGRLASDAYNAIVASATEIDEQKAILKALIFRHRRSIRREAAANAQGKRSAS